MYEEPNQMCAENAATFKLELNRRVNVYRPSFGTCIEVDLGQCPHLFEKIALAIILQIVWAIPMAVREENRGFVDVLP